MSARRNLVAALVVAALGYTAILLLDGPVHDESGLGSAVPWPAIGAETLSRLMGLQAIHQPDWFELDGVVGAGIGWAASGRPALKVFVEPGAAVLLPPMLEGFPLIVEEAGPFRALDRVQEAETVAPSAARASSGDDLLSTARFDRPVPIGISTGHLNSTAGTIGAVVTDGSDRYALSNWHVFVPAGNARLGDPLLQPGPYDGGANPADVIGTLAAFEPVTLSPFANNRIDAALARTDDVAARTPAGGYGSPRTETLRARPGLPVQKYGRTTGQTYGVVESINTSINVTYGSAGSRVARFNGQIVICCDFSAGGDSGSLIVAHDTDDEGRSGPNDRRPVALLFAGDRTRTIANPIDLVLDRFEVRIVGEDGEGR